MNPNPEAHLLRIMIRESDKLHHVPLFEHVVREAKAFGLAGAVAWRGLMGYGLSDPVHTAKILDLSADLPVIIELIDDEEKIGAFRPVLDRLFREAGCGGVVTLETVQAFRYPPGPCSD